MGFWATTRAALYIGGTTSVDYRLYEHLDLNEGGRMAKYRSDLSEPVKDADGRYRPDFFTA